MGEVENSMAIFVVATYGEGDPTDNAQELYEWLQNDRDDLDCLNYTVSIPIAVNCYIYVKNQLGIFTLFVNVLFYEA